MVKRAERKEQTRKKLLESAKQVFAENGYASTKVRDIVTLAGVAVGTFYVHFKDKQSLFEEIMRGSIREMLDVLGARVAKEKGTVARVEAVFEEFLEHLERNWNLFVMLRESRDVAGGFARILKDVFVELTSNLEAILVKGMERGELAELESGILARALVAMAVESIAMVREGAAGKEQVIETLKVMVFEGIKKKD